MVGKHREGLFAVATMSPARVSESPIPCEDGSKKVNSAISLMMGGVYLYFYLIIAYGIYIQYLTVLVRVTIF